MDLLRALHNIQIPNVLPVPLTPTPLALFCLVLFLWSFGPALKQDVRAGFVVWLRLTWAIFLLPAVTGALLALGGAQVPSATRAPAEYIRDVCQASGDLSRHCLPVDPSQNGMHWMYVLFTVLSLIVIEVLIRGRVIERGLGLKALPVVTLFMYGAAYMIGHSATFPGSTPGT